MCVLTSIYRPCWPVDPALLAPRAHHTPQQSAHSPSLDDLSALLPEEVRFPQPTLCKVTTEEERGVEIGRSSSSARPEVVVGDSPAIFEVHLRVLLRDFATTSAADFEVSDERFA